MNNNTVSSPAYEKKKGGLKNFIRSPKAKRGSIAILITVLFTAAVIALNIVVSVLYDRYPSMSLDLTKSSVFELQSDTQKYISGLDKKVELYILRSETDFESGGEYYVQANKLLKKLVSENNNISLKYIDLSSNPTFTTPYTSVDWTTEHLILAVSGDNYRALDAEDMFDYDQQYLYYYGSYMINGQHVEQAVVTAVLNITTEDKVKVAVLSGQDEEDCSVFTSLLSDNAYDVEEVNLLTGEIPDDARFLIIFDPSRDIDSDIYSSLSDWLYNGGDYGHTLLYLPNDQKSVSEFTNLNKLLDEWGMKVSDGYIYETDTSKMTNSQFPNLISVFDYADDKYTEGLDTTSVPVVLFYTVPIEITDDKLASPLLKSSDSAVILPKDADENWNYKDEEPASLIGAAIATQSGENGESQLIVIGSYDAWSKSALSSSSFNNSAYFINMFNKIADRDEIGITIEGKSLDSAELGISSASVTSVISALVRYVIPALILIVGLIVWLRRRNR